MVQRDKAALRGSHLLTVQSTWQSEKGAVAGGCELVGHTQLQAGLRGGAHNIAVEDMALAVTALGSALVVLLVVTIDRSESVKGLGLEARTRKLEVTINKPEVAVGQP